MKLGRVQEVGANATTVMRSMSKISSGGLCPLER
jgi:hypothetical protein